MTEHGDHALPESERLTGNLGFIGTLVQPLAVLAPSGSAFIVPAAMAGFVGAATPLAFLLGVVVGLFVAYSFSLFASRYATSGSVYGFNRTALGPGYAFASAWILLCAYLSFGVAIAVINASYLNSLWPAYGRAVPWEVTSVVIMVLVLLLAYREVEVSSKVIAACEVIGLSGLVLIAVVVIAKGGYGGHSLSWKPFQTNGLSFSSLMFGVAFAFVGLGGFESAAVLGEESKNPTRSIPRAIYGGLLFGGFFITLAGYVEVIGFPDPTALSQSTIPLVTLADNFIGGTFVGKLITAAVILTTFGTAVGLLQASSRLFYSFARDGVVPERLARTHPTFGTPVYSMFALWSLIIVTMLAFTGKDPGAPFVYLSTTGAIALLIAYLLTTIAASVRFRASKHMVIPMIGIPILCYILYRNVIPIPPSPLDYFIYLAVVWLAVSIVAILVSKGLRRRLANSQELTLISQTTSVSTQST